MLEASNIEITSKVRKREMYTRNTRVTDITHKKISVVGSHLTRDIYSKDNGITAANSFMST